MELTPEIKVMLIEGAKALKGADRRLFMARAVRAMGYGGQARAEQHLGRTSSIARVRPILASRRHGSIGE